MAVAHDLLVHLRRAHDEIDRRYAEPLEGRTCSGHAATVGAALRDRGGHAGQLRQLASEFPHA